MEVFKWMALPETQKAISVCHIQAVCDSDGLPDAFCGTMCFAMHRNISLNSPKSRRGSQRNLSAVVFKGNYVKSHLPDVWKWQNCIFVAGKNEPLLHSIILFLMWWLRHFTSKCEQVTTGFHSTNCGSSALRREKKKKQAHDVHSRTLRRWRTLQILRLSEGRLCFVLFEGAALWYLVIRPWMLTHPCFNTVTGTRRWFMEL